MRLMITLLLAITLASVATLTTTNHAMTNETENPLLAKWEGPHGGAPPFDRVQIAVFKPELQGAMAEQLAGTDPTANNPAAADCENTIAALERTGHTLDRVTTLYGIWSATMASPEFQAVQREMAPRLAAFNDQITQNEALFKRIEGV